MTTSTYRGQTSANGDASDGARERGESGAQSWLRGLVDLGWVGLVQALLLAILIVGPLVTGAVRRQDFLWIEGLATLAASAWIVRVWTDRGFGLAWPPVCWVTAGIVLYAMVRLGSASVKFAAREEAGRILVYAIMLVMFVDVMRRERFRRMVVEVLLVLAAGIAVYAVWQYLTESVRVWHFVQPRQYAGRASGTYINPNHLAGYLGMVMPVALARVVWGQDAGVRRVASILVLAAIATGMGCTLSRGGWAATGCASAVVLSVFARSRRYWFRASVWATILLSGVILFASSDRAQQRLSGTFAGGQIQDVRWLVWKAAFRMWQDHFWFGVGPGHFGHRFRAYRPPEIQMRPERVHNDYLNALVDWGIIGGALGLTGLIMVGRCMGRVIGRVGCAESVARPRSEHEVTQMGVCGGMLALMFHSIVDFNLHVPANAILATCWVGFLCSPGKPRVNQGAEQWSRRFGLGLAAVMGCSLMWVVVHAQTRLREHRHLLRAGRIEAEMRRLTTHVGGVKRPSPEFDSASEELRRLGLRWIGHLKAAHAVEPDNFETTYRIGEALRAASWEGQADWQSLATEALPWFRRGIKLNPWDPDNYLGYGMCLHWVRRYGETQTYFDRALALDPNGAYTLARIGWHYLNLSRPQEALEWFERSLQLKPHREKDDNPFAQYYWNVVRERVKSTNVAR